MPTLIGVPVGVPPVVDEAPAVVELPPVVALVDELAAVLAVVPEPLLLLELPQAAATKATAANSGTIHRTCLRILPP
jgi:hypothetical protein